jgi:acyl carrier protein
MADKVATVESRIRDILAMEHGVDEIGVSETLEQAGLDSLDRVEFWMNVETEFNLPETHPDTEDECLTVAQVCAYVERKENTLAISRSLRYPSV